MPIKQKRSGEELAQEEAEEVKEDLDNIYLLEKIDNLQIDKQKFLILNKTLNGTIKDLKEEQDATYNYMTLESNEKGALLLSLQSQLENIKAEKDIASIEYHNHIERLIKKNATDEAKAADIIEGLQIKLFSISEYIAEKSTKDDSMKDLNDTLARERVEFINTFESLQMKNWEEREQLRLNYASDVLTLKNELSAQVNKKLSSQTKKAMMVNLFVTKQLYSQVIGIFYFQEMIHIYLLIHIQNS